MSKARELRVMTFNVAGGGARSVRPVVPVYGDARPVVAKVAELIARERPHVVGLQEVPLAHPWHRGPGDKIQNAADLLTRALAKTRWPMKHSEVQNYHGNKRLGVMVLSRFRVRDYRVRPFKRRERERSPVQAFRVREARNGQDFWFFNYHGNVHQPGWALLALRNFIKQTLPAGSAGVVLGDFNLQNRLAASFSKLQKMKEVGFLDACELNGGGSCKLTVNTEIHRQGGGVDYIQICEKPGTFYAEPWQVNSIRSVPEINSEVMVSDHLPVVAKIRTVQGSGGSGGGRPRKKRRRKRRRG